MPMLMLICLLTIVHLVDALVFRTHANVVDCRQDPKKGRVGKVCLLRGDPYRHAQAIEFLQITHPLIKLGSDGLLPAHHIIVIIILVVAVAVVVFIVIVIVIVIVGSVRLRSRQGHNDNPFLLRLNVLRGHPVQIGHDLES